MAYDSQKESNRHLTAAIYTSVLWRRMKAVQEGERQLWEVGDGGERIFFFRKGTIELPLHKMSHSPVGKEGWEICWVHSSYVNAFEHHLHFHLPSTFSFFPPTKEELPVIALCSASLSHYISSSS